MSYVSNLCELVNMQKFTRPLSLQSIVPLGSLLVKFRSSHNILAFSFQQKTHEGWVIEPRVFGLLQFVHATYFDLFPSKILIPSYLITMHVINCKHLKQWKQPTFRKWREIKRCYSLRSHRTRKLALL